MNLRDWATPLTMGSFMLMAVTGLLMFFEIDTGFNKPAHEWLSWALLAGVGMHVTANIHGAKRHFQHRPAFAIVGVFVVVLGLSFMPAPKGGEDSGRALAMDALLSRPLSMVAQLAGKDVSTVVTDLEKSGVKISADQSLQQVLGEDHDEQMDALGVIFAKQN
ncbi:uncharacterized protein DUF4405 [Fluviicoccus keumensis]|uniref:Uncharacterized protein DUF4405 n=1 Tax=Fluviicoccus keumensis TaxID=1435465 RepID=A0A4Q7YKR3_9GAMM|nr:DUF4405 domain-containing protein [Fluviicoccus keumensis]RZU37105.1 uncharacterized protein DUF4405 [Fluviicoccus keumensis]